MTTTSHVTQQQNDDDDNITFSTAPSPLPSTAKSPPPPQPPPPPTTPASACIPLSILCHGCFQPSPAPLIFPCRHGHCRGAVRYCSTRCRDRDCCRNDDDDHNGYGDDGDGTGMHSRLRCVFIRRYCYRRRPELDRGGTAHGAAGDGGRSTTGVGGGIVQIGVVEESFPEYVLSSESVLTSESELKSELQSVTQSLGACMEDSDPSCAVTAPDRCGWLYAAADTARWNRNGRNGEVHPLRRDGTRGAHRPRDRRRKLVQ